MRSVGKIRFATLALTALSFSSSAFADVTTPEAQSAVQQAAITKNQAPAAFASAIVPGEYRDRKQDLALFIKNVGSTHYAVIMWKSQFMSLYRIEEVDASTQAWVQLIQGADNVLTTEANNTATYAVTQIRTDKDLSLRFTMTAYAKTLGPNVYCTITPNFKFESPNSSWGSFKDLKTAELRGRRNRRSDSTVVRSEDNYGHALETPEIEKNPKDSYDKKLDVVLTNAGQPDQWNLLINNLIIESESGRAFVSKLADNRMQQPLQFVYRGDFRGEEVLPGLMLVRRRELDSTSGSGLKIERQVSFFAIALGHAMEVMAMPPTARDCAYTRNELK